MLMLATPGSSTRLLKYVSEVDVLVLGHTPHTVVRRLLSIGRSVLGVSDLVLAPHVPPEAAVANCLEDVTGHHTVGSGLVSWSLRRQRGKGSNDVAHTVRHEDAGRGDNSLGVGTDVGGDHDETDGETDGLTVDQPESDKSGPSVLVGEGEEGHHSGTEDTDQITDGHHEKTSVSPSGSDKTGNEQRDDLERSPSAVEKSGVEGGVTETFDDGTGEVGQDPVGDGRTKHGNGQEPADMLARD